MKESEVREFYDSFLKSTMVKYRLYGNARIDKAIDRILEYTTKNSKILDIGCGIGIVPEKISKKAKEGHVWGIDISEENIWYSNKTIKRNNTSFLQCDIVTEFKRLKEFLDEKIDILTMVDVIEHIPEKNRVDLFKNIEKLITNSGKVILTYPSPEYQKQLIYKEKDKLQIIDNIIEIDTLIKESSSAGLKLYHYSLESIWRKNDYVHVILEKESNDN
jgi:2-polyprenyl-3-methyl-5-hydroxy-6-metoxy-1,4-benzoquinol methylase